MYKHIVLITAITIILISCGSRRTFETQAPTQSFASYAIIEIPDFKSDIPNSPPELQWQLPNQLAKKLKSDSTFTGVSRSPLDITNGVLIVDGTVTDMQPPEWYKQIVKTGKIVIKVRFIDKAESLVIAESTFEGTSKWGLLGGAMVFADVRAIDEIFDYLKANYRAN
ncbi:MAG: hypothetical protein ACR2NW_02245 [Thermodesulfobacteriota bacterium]